MRQASRLDDRLPVPSYDRVHVRVRVAVRTARAPCAAGASAHRVSLITTDGFPRSPRAAPPSRARCTGRSRARANFAASIAPGLRRPPPPERSRGLGRERPSPFLALHLAERRFALLRKIRVSAFPPPLDDRVDVHKSRPRRSATSRPTVVLARPRRPISTMCRFTTPRPSRAGPHLCQVPLEVPLGLAQRSPPNFSSRACGEHQGIIASAMNPMAGTAVTSDRSDCAWAGPARLQVHGAQAAPSAWRSASSRHARPGAPRASCARMCGPTGALSGCRCQAGACLVAHLRAGCIARPSTRPATGDTRGMVDERLRQPARSSLAAPHETVGARALHRRQGWSWGSGSRPRGARARR